MTIPWLAFGAAAIYALGVNPWVVPEHYDVLLYHEAANNLALGKGYVYAGKLIRDWPPLFPAALSLLRGFGSIPIWVDKVAVLTLVPFALGALHRVLVAEGHPHALVTCLIVALSPTALRYGTAVMSEWPYLLGSSVFLFALHSLSQRRTLARSAAVGCLLGACALVRYAGVFLGAAVLAQAVQAWRNGKGGARSAWPELVVGAVGGALFLTWQAYLGLSDAPEGASVNLARETYDSFHPVAVLQAIGNVLIASEGVASTLALPSPISLLLWLVPSSLALAGLLLGLRRRAPPPSTFYVATYVAFLCVYEDEVIASHTRYLLPVAPFLVSGLLASFDSLTCRLARSPRPYLITGWCLALGMADAQLLFRGTDVHSGLCPCVSANERDFYRGSWRDLYDAASSLAADLRPGSVRTIVGHDSRFVRWFSKRDAASQAAAGEKPAFFLEVDGTTPHPGWRLRSQHGAVRVYEPE